LVRFCKGLGQPRELPDFERTPMGTLTTFLYQFCAYFYPKWPVIPPESALQTQNNELYTRIIPFKLRGEVQALRGNPSKIRSAVGVFDLGSELTGR